MGTALRLAGSPAGAPISPTIVSLVVNQGLRINVLDQRSCASKAVRLSGCEHQLDGIAPSA
jgi:hypothetical protein